MLRDRSVFAGLVLYRLDGCCLEIHCYSLRTYNYLMVIRQDAFSCLVLLGLSFIYPRGLPQGRKDWQTYQHHSVLQLYHLLLLLFRWNPEVPQVLFNWILQKGNSLIYWTSHLIHIRYLYDETLGAQKSKIILQVNSLILSQQALKVPSSDRHL